MILTLLGQNCNQEDNGTITPYEEQKQLLIKKLSYECNYKEIEIANVDGFQGKHYSGGKKGFHPLKKAFFGKHLLCTCARVHVHKKNAKNQTML